MTRSDSLIKRKLLKARQFRRITIILPADSKMPTIRGKWHRLADGRIRAWYTTAELEQCKKMVAAIVR